MPNAVPRPITPRGIAIDESAAAPFDSVHAARHLLRTAVAATLATTDPQSGYPYATVTNLAVEPDGTPFFFAAGLSLHARNIEADSRIALSLATPGRRDSLTTPRLMLVGKAVRVPAAERQALDRLYEARFPKSRLYLALPDAVFYRLHVEDLQLNGGPARNAVSDVTPATLKTDLAGAEALMSAAWTDIERLNAMPGEAARLAARAGEKPASWRVVGLDPDGLDLASHEKNARLWFGARVIDPQGLAGTLSA